jgi:hypothetical protein
MLTRAKIKRGEGILNTFNPKVGRASQKEENGRTRQV